MKGWSVDRKASEFLNSRITSHHGVMAMPPLSPADYLLTSTYTESHNLTTSTEQEIMFGYSGHRDSMNEEEQGLEDVMGLETAVFNNFCKL